MISFKTFVKQINEAVVYKPALPSTLRDMANREHDETVHQKDVETPHPAISAAIKSFATNKPKFVSAVVNSKIERIKHGTEVNNSEIGQGSNAVEDKTKLSRVKKQIGSQQGVERPIILRHTDSEGNTYHHLLAGNTRATVIGYGVQSHIVDV